MTNWMPDANATTKAGGGWLLEVPIRAAGLPVNLWVHWSGLAVNWPPYFFGGTQDSDWDRETGTVMVQVAEGDVALAGVERPRMASAAPPASGSPASGTSPVLSS